ncbi:MAG: glycosyltransferase [Mongoliibacter sp.]|uniref:glycosyltransferase family 4 protein n=1 Tax=Mongoliibacter sp. TaxID=2022438 RepID=UPI0012F2BD3C|nr:glycosyltransferase [Mongoliibacter sp.]TVP51704.1 MAG: glycosyltransferase [Mongoliibacter sp.]
MEKPKALIVVPSFQSFILQDIELLSERYELTINHYDWRNKALAPVYLFRQFFHLLVTIPQCRFILIHFGGYWSFFPTLLGKIFGKPSYIILHGTDCASIPELNYGSLRIPLLKWFCKKSYEWATKLFPVSDSLIFTKNSYINYEKPIFNGLKHHFPNLQTPILVIPNGFDTHFWVPDEKLKTNPNSYLTVLSTSQFYLKGGDLIIQLAEQMPESKFQLVGLNCPPDIERPKNVEFLGRLEKKELKIRYQSSAYYMQISSFEGFGCALCEAMLCGCIPIVSEVNALSQIIGDTGVTVPFRRFSNLQISVQMINSLTKGQNINQYARKRIMELFPLEKRRDLLFESLQN